MSCVDRTQYLPLANAVIFHIILRGIRQRRSVCKLQSSVPFEHLDKQHELHYTVQSELHTASFSVEKVSDASAWQFFTSRLIVVIRNSTSSDSYWVRVGWLESFDWMWNKQGLPQCTTKAIKWSLWGGPSRLWWLCAGHESAFCIWSLSALSLYHSLALSVLICHCYYLSSHYSIQPLMYLLQRQQSIVFPCHLSFFKRPIFLFSHPEVVCSKSFFFFNPIKC